jgi:hypothetical protein
MRRPQDDVARYRQLCLRSVGAQATRDPAATNRAAQELNAIASEWLASNDGRRRLIGLLDDPSAEVRLSAAGALLGTAPDLAMPALRNLTHEPGFVGLEAKWALRAKAPTSASANPPQIGARAGEGGEARIRSSTDAVAADLMRFHSLVMSRGLLQAAEEYRNSLPTLARAYGAIGLPDVAALIMRTIRRLQVVGDGTERGLPTDRLVEAEFEDLDAEYHEVLPSDSALIGLLAPPTLRPR